MASTATKRPKHDAGPAVVLFGIGDGGKPRAAYFPAAHAELAVKAAKAMNLSVLKVAGLLRLEHRGYPTTGTRSTSATWSLPN